MEAGYALRALRTGVFAAVCVLLAALGHALMSAAPVPWWTIASAVAVTGAAAWPLTGRERGPLPVTAATVAVQGALHVAFTLAQGAAARGAAAGGSAAGESAHTAHRFPAHAMHGMPMHAIPVHEMPVPTDSGAGTGMGAMPMDMSAHAHGALGMWSAHALVALVCGLWLSGGEQAAFRLTRALAVRLFTPLLTLLAGAPPAPRPAPVRRARPGGATQRLRRLLLVHVIATRGPPPGHAVG